MGQFDPRGDLWWGDRPQRRHGLHGAERQVIPGNGGRLGAAVLGDGGGDLTGIPRVAAVLGAEEIAGHVGAHRGPLVHGDGPVRRQPGSGVDPGQALGDLKTERADVTVVHLERCPKPGRQVLIEQGPRRGAFVCEGVEPGTEQGLHLLGSDDVTSIQPVDSGHARTHPHAGRFAAFGVVGRQPGVALVGGIQRSDLPGQVVIPRPRSELVDTHRHTRRRHICGGLVRTNRGGTLHPVRRDLDMFCPGMQKVCSASML